MPKALVFQAERARLGKWAIPITDTDTIILLGRDSAPEPPAFTINIPDDTVSRNHGRILKRDGRFWLEDLGSKNLTYLNGKAVFGCRDFQTPCEIVLGHVRLNVSIDMVPDAALSTRGDHKVAAMVSGITQPATGATASILRTGWPEVREELRWSACLKQILDATRMAATADQARQSVAAAIRAYLRARRVLLLEETNEDGLQRALTDAGVDGNAHHASAPGNAPHSPRPADSVHATALPDNTTLWTWAVPDGSDRVLSAVAWFDGEEAPAVARPQTLRLFALAFNLLLSTDRAFSDLATSRERAGAIAPIRFSDELAEHIERAGYWGLSPQFRQLLGEVEKAVRGLRRLRDRLPNILLTGESGVGKSALVSVIHKLSDHAGGPLIECDGTRLHNPDIAASELFGHEKGAFTGADRRVIGRFERANRGILFIDEIGTLPPDSQKRLLRVLDTGRFERMGGDTPIAVDCYVVFATNTDLEARVAAGEFREDLYRRIATWEISIPPLRERPDDIRCITERFLAFMNARQEPASGCSLEPELLDRLVAYDWPGNVRELTDTLEAAYHADADGVIRPDDLPGKFRALLGSNGGPLSRNGFQIDTRTALDDNIQRVRMEYLAHLFAQSGGAVAKVARTAKISPQTLLDYRKSFPALLHRLPEEEVGRLQAIAGPYWDRLFIGDKVTDS